MLPCLQPSKGFTHTQAGRMCFSSLINIEAFWAGCFVSQTSIHILITRTAEEINNSQDQDNTCPVNTRITPKL